MRKTPTQPTANHPTPVGGGIKKVMYTLRTAHKAGWRPTAKALRANNTCKACGLGMGGQRGGMTNELGEFPAVCNKSVQAQSSDLQPPIPSEIFNHPLHELAQLSERQCAQLGRLNTPLYKPRDAQQYQPINWTTAIDIASQRFANTDPARSFFYSSGRASNEAGFLLQLLARLYGTNNVNNCSYYCHQATSVALENSIGTGTATVELADLAQSDCVFLFGANPASNHPRLIHQLKACRERGGQVIVVNPAKEPGLVRFAVPKSPTSLIAGGSAIASQYLQPRIGSDIALCKGLAKAIIAGHSDAKHFVQRHTDGWQRYRADIDATSWHSITQTTGLQRSQIEAVAQSYANAKRAVFAWGMGLTHHQHGVDNIEQLANLALLRGMVGKLGAGLLPLRGHSNVQGIGTMGVKPVLPADVFASLERELDIELPKTPGLDTMAAMQAAERGEIDAALLMGGNLFGSNPNSHWAEQALGQVGFKLFLTTSLNRGHFHGVAPGEALILPVTARDEEPQPTTQESMFNFVRLSSGGISRLDNLRSESQILCALGRRLISPTTFDFTPFEHQGSVRKAIAATVPGMEPLASIDVAREEFHVRGRLMHQPNFATPNGRAQFRTTPIPADSYPPNDDTFTLTSVRSEGQFNTIIYEEADSYRGVTDRWTVLMNGQDMQQRHIEPGARINIRSEHGGMAQVAVQPFDLPSGNLMAYFPEANLLIGTQVDPRSKTPSFKATRVWLETGERDRAGPARASSR